MATQWDTCNITCYYFTVIEECAASKVFDGCQSFERTGGDPSHDLTFEHDSSHGDNSMATNRPNLGDTPFDRTTTLTLILWQSKGRARS
jgi:hypothetical protein